MIDLEERRDALAEALVSGDYVQTQGALHRRDGYCCLGVACEIFRRITGIGEWTYDDDSGKMFFRIYTLERNAISMPEAVQEFYGFQSALGNFNESRGGVLSLADMNDLGVPFEGIAEVIRNRPAGMFS